MEEDKLYKLMNDIAEINRKMAIIETKLDQVVCNNTKIEDAYSISRENANRLNKLDDSIKWAFRTSVGAIIICAIEFLLKIKNG